MDYFDYMCNQPMSDGKEIRSFLNEELGGKKTCKYYNTCGNVDNCKSCKGYEKRKEKAK